MKTFQFLGFFFALLLVQTPVFADVTQFDQDDAHVIVVRPLDAWAGNRVIEEYTIDYCYKKKKVGYYYVTELGEKILGTPGSFDQFSDTSIQKQVKTLLEILGRDTRGSSGCVFTFEKPSTVKPEEMPAILLAQDALNKENILRQGNPETLPDRISRKRFVGTVLSVALFAVGMDKLGPVSGTQFGFSTGLFEDVAKLSIGAQKSLVSVPSMPFDYSAYKTVDVRKISGAQGQTGQVIIAYKNDKTPEIEDRLLAKAIVIASGADTTLEAINAARSADRAARQVVWDACVTEKKCKIEE